MYEKSQNWHVHSLYTPDSFFGCLKFWVSQKICRLSHFQQIWKSCSTRTPKIARFMSWINNLLSQSLLYSVFRFLLLACLVASQTFFVVSQKLVVSQIFFVVSRNCLVVSKDCWSTSRNNSMKSKNSKNSKMSRNTINRQCVLSRSVWISLIASVQRILLSIMPSKLDLNYQTTPVLNNTLRNKIHCS